MFWVLCPSLEAWDWSRFWARLGFVMAVTVGLARWRRAVSTRVMMAVAIAMMSLARLMKGSRCSTMCSLSLVAGQAGRRG